MKNSTPAKPRFDYMDAVDTASRALESYYADDRRDIDPKVVNRKAHEFVSMLVEVFNQVDCQAELSPESSGTR